MKYIPSVIAGAALGGVISLAVGWQQQVQAPSVPPEVIAAARPISLSLNRFGFNLLAEQIKQERNRNLLFSPYSVAAALTMTCNGAGGTTQAAMAKALALENLSLEEANRAHLALRRTLTQPEEGIRCHIANALWANVGITFAPAFVERARRFYDAHASTLNFHDPAALDTIHAWVDKSTGGKIKTLLTSADLAAADSVLTNAIYFKGLWMRPFDPARTRHRIPFTLPGGKQKNVSMMYQEGMFACLERPDFKAVALPYGRGQASMYLFLPAEGSDLPTFLRQLDARNWDAWMAEFRRQKRLIGVPRFKIEHESLLNESLSALGMEEAFNAGADFGPMGLEGDWIGVVKHKAVVEVNEEGTEAAAATVVTMTRSISPSIVFSRPFFFAIRDNRTGALLFMGTVNDPDEVVE